MNITAFLHERAAKTPEKIAFITNREEASYREVDRLTWQCSQFFYAQGIRSGDVVACAFKSEIELAFALMGLARIGATIFPFSLNQTTYIRSKLFQQVTLKLILTDDIKAIQHPPVTVRRFSINDVKKVPVEGRFIMDETPDSPLIIVPGSGSTGDPKLISVTHAQMVARLPSIELLSSDRYTSLVNLQYLGEMTRFFACLYSGGAFYFGSLMRGDLFKSLDSKCVSVLVICPFQIELLINSKPGKEALKGLRQIRTGGTTVSMGLRKRMLEELGHAPYIIYATNETGCIAICQPEDALADEYSVGKVRSDVQLRIIKSLSEGSDAGLIQVKTPGCFSGYADTILNETHFFSGWFQPNDAGLLKPDGTLLHFGRADEMIITNGINIFPAQIENCLKDFFGVKDVATLPFNSGESQRFAVSFVALESGISVSTEELLAFTRDKLGFYAPKQIHIVPEIPRNDRGKVIRKELLEQLR